MNTDLMFSSQTDLWKTPQWLFDELNQRYLFDLDPCALPENAKCDTYFTPEIDGLSQSWAGHRVFCNPPYGREIGKWIKKCHDEAQKGTLVVALLPSRTDTKWFHDYIYGKAHRVEFLRGRLKFGGHRNSAPFPSMIVEF